MRIPRLVIAGLSSGVGKTSFTVALARAFRSRGLEVATFKCGPDYLDPTYHERASGRTSHTLDGWMMGRDSVLQTFEHGAAGAHLALVEGVMGLYDGASPASDEGSAAEIARWLGAPVLAVVDASGMARTIAAVGIGLRELDRRLDLRGLLANRIGSAHHLELLQSASRPYVPVLGGLLKLPDARFPERHLGLRTADATVDRAIDELASRIEETCSLDAIMAIASSAPELHVPERTRRASTPARVRVGFAHDEAFHFYYPENLLRLEASGAELVPFSPVHDVSLPPGLDGLYIGGGYPELHAAALGANGSMRDAVVALAARGAPVYAECGGLMYVSEGIAMANGEHHPMVGLIPGVAVMSERLEALGYVEVELACSTPLGAPGARFRGHQFRYSRLEGAAPGEAYRMRRRRGQSVEQEGHLFRNVLASYVHAHFASNPLLASSFVAACARNQKSA